MASRQRWAMGACLLGAGLLCWWVPEASAATQPGDSVTTALTLMVLALLGMVALGLPIFVILGVLAVLAYDLLGADFQGLDTLRVLPEEIQKLTTKDELLAIPFFVASGALMSAGGIASRLVAFARSLLGWMPGGLAVATVGACVFFAAISGSSPVTVIAIGTMMYPALQKAGYERRFTLGLLSSAGSLGILIPPSIPMLVYALVAGGRSSVDSGELFLAGVLPGLLIGVLLAGYSILRAPKEHRKPFSWVEVWLRFRDGVWAIVLPLMILGGIYGGIFTPTQAAAVSVIYALIVELLIHRDITVHDLPRILGDAAVTMGSILIIMSLAVALNIFLVEERIPDQVVEMIVAMNLGPIGFLLIVNGFLLLVGAIMDAISAILIIAPLLAPIGAQLGIDPVHMGVIFIINLEIGYLTPPIGINLFVASSVFRRPVGEVSQGVVPFIGMMMFGLLLVTYVPSIALGPVNVWMRGEEFYEPFPSLSPDDEKAAGESVSGDEPGVLSIEEIMRQQDQAPAARQPAADDGDDGYYGEAEEQPEGDGYYGEAEEEPAGDGYYGDRTAPPADAKANDDGYYGDADSPKPKSLEELMGEGDGESG